MSARALPRVAWGLTGSGHHLVQCMAMALACPRMDLFLSAAAYEVLPRYGYSFQQLRANGRVFRDKTASAVPVGLFYRGCYDLLVIAPATSNSIAKMVCGISDSLISNIYAQATKCRISTIVHACDSAPALETEAPDGKVMVYPRAIDLENAQTLKQFAYTEVSFSVTELQQQLERYTRWPRHTSCS